MPADQTAEFVPAKTSGKTGPLVAVVTPVYNGAKFLRANLASVQAQTYPNLVHVVLDNASTDETPAIIKGFENGKIPLLIRRNAELLPMVHNWNAALGHVPEEAVYVRYLSADDTLTPDSIARMVEVAESDPEIGVVVCDVARDGLVDGTLWPKDVTIADGEAAVRSYFRNESVIIANQVLLRRTALAHRKELYDPGIVAFDGEAVLDMLHGCKLGVVHETLCMSGTHAGSSTVTNSDRWRLHHLEWFIALERHGPRAFSAAEWAEIGSRYRRHYVRKLITWRRDAHGRAVVARHMTRLKELNAVPSFGEYVAAAFDGLLVKLKLKPGWTGCPW